MFVTLSVVPSTSVLAFAECVPVGRASATDATAAVASTARATTPASRQVTRLGLIDPPPSRIGSRLSSRANPHRAGMMGSPATSGCEYTTVTVPRPLGDVVASRRRRDSGRDCRYAVRQFVLPDTRYDA